ncbi:hypothetical protein CTI12_AA508730 [Artemisia annua]|uniref:Uncharacterized protein n=1 Tax=Artemisia annua TaxID=35608 RepID=A0A2U1LCS3_ARTAN|nr:hypothetical protein CTI12_AA508730 [Artemisia annua]
MSLRMDHHSENPTWTNHVNAYGKWKEFAEDCNFDYDKMLRFKYIQTIEGDNGDEDSVPRGSSCPAAVFGELWGPQEKSQK